MAQALCYLRSAPITAGWCQSLQLSCSLLTETLPYIFSAFLIASEGVVWVSELDLYSLLSE